MTYEYACAACNHHWEAEQSISDKPLKKCPRCSKAKAKRLVSGGTGFLLKGGGWYADGYGSSSSKSRSDSDSASSSESSTADKGSTSKTKKAGKKSEQPAA